MSPTPALSDVLGWKEEAFLRSRASRLANGDRHLAFDLAQEGRVAVWKALDRWDRSRPFWPFAQVRAAHAMVSALDRQNPVSRWHREHGQKVTFQPLPAPEEDGWDIADPSPYGRDPADIVVQRESRAERARTRDEARVDKALGHLTERQREVLLAVASAPRERADQAVGNTSAAARALGVSETAVRQTVARALPTLRAHLEAA